MSWGSKAQSSGFTFLNSCRKSSVLLSAVFLGTVSVPAPSACLWPVLQGPSCDISKSKSSSCGVLLPHGWHV